MYCLIHSWTPPPFYRWIIRGKERLNNVPHHKWQNQKKTKTNKQKKTHSSDSRANRVVSLTEMTSFNLVDLQGRSCDFYPEKRALWKLGHMSRVTEVGEAHASARDTTWPPLTRTNRHLFIFTTHKSPEID